MKHGTEAEQLVEEGRRAFWQREQRPPRSAGGEDLILPDHKFVKPPKTQPSPPVDETEEQTMSTAEADQQAVEVKVPEVVPARVWPQAYLAIIYDNRMQLLRRDLATVRHPLDLRKPRSQQKFPFTPDEKTFSKKLKQQLAALELEQAAEREFWTRIHTGIARMKALANIQGNKLIALIACHKGTASKSTISLYVGSIIAYFCHKSTLLFPTTENKVNASHGSMTELDLTMAMRMTQFIERVEAGEFKDFNDLWVNISTTAAGLGLVAEDAKKNLGAENANGADQVNETTGESKRKRLTLRQFLNAQDVILANTQIEFLDCGNDDIDEGTIVLEAARLATAMLFSSNFDKKNTIRLMGETISTYHSDPYKVQETTVHGVLTNGVIAGQTTPKDGRHCSTRFKVEQAAVLSNLVPNGESVDFDKYTEGIHRTGSSRLIAPDPYIGRADEPPCDIHSIEMTTFLSYLEIAVDLLTQSANTLGLDASWVNDIVVTEGYHPQKQRLDEFGNFIPRDEINMSAIPEEVFAPVMASPVTSIKRHGGEFTPAAAPAPAPWAAPVPRRLSAPVDEAPVGYDQIFDSRPAATGRR